MPKVLDWSWVVATYGLWPSFTLTFISWFFLKSVICYIIQTILLSRCIHFLFLLCSSPHNFCLPLYLKFLFLFPNLSGLIWLLLYLFLEPYRKYAPMQANHGSPSLLAPLLFLIEDSYQLFLTFSVILSTNKLNNINHFFFFFPLALLFPLPFLPLGIRPVLILINVSRL